MVLGADPSCHQFPQWEGAVIWPIRASDILKLDLDPPITSYGSKAVRTQVVPVG